MGDVIETAKDKLSGEESLLSGVVVTGFFAGAGVVATLPLPIITVAVPFSERTSVPLPSAANTLAVSKEIVAEPSLSALKLMVITTPDAPEYALGDPPEKLAVPALLENVGSEVQSENTEPSLLMEFMANKAGSNLTTPSAALIPTPPPESTATLMEKLSPVPTSAVCGKNTRRAPAASPIRPIRGSTTKIAIHALARMRVME